MTYDDTIDYLFSQLPAYQRIGKAAYKADLNTTLRIAEILNHPERQFKSVHIAGTNGKGSVSHMLASVMQEAGYKTGLYTSPHLKDFRERIKINGQSIPKESILKFVERYQEDFEHIGSSFFEWTVGLAFKYFEEEEVDIAILETGMGGRLDSTNIVIPELSIITNIGMDHAMFLGNTLPLIAGEKAGIIKNNVPTVIGQTQLETEALFRKTASEKNSTISFADQEIKGNTYESDLKGNYQRYNQRTALQALHVLQEKGWAIEEEAIVNGFEKVVKNTGLMGRWQQLSANPMTICDTAHNEDGLLMVMEQLLRLTYVNLHIVLGMVNDKEIGKLLELFPKDAVYYFCQPNIPRGLNAEKLAEVAEAKKLKGSTYTSVSEAYEKAQQIATDQDVIFVGGSTFTVAEVV